MNTLVCRAAAALALLLAAACGGGESENPPPETAATASAPSSAVTQLKLRVASPRRTPLAAAVAARLQTALVAAGYNLVASEAAPHDLTARLAVSAVQEQSMFQVTVSGRQQVKLKVHAALTLVGNAGIVDEVTQDFESANGEVTDDNVAPLVARLNGSPRLSSYANDQANARQVKVAADQAAAQAAQAQKQAVIDSKKAEWDGIVGDCRAPTSLTSCDSLKAWYRANTPRHEGTDTYAVAPELASKLTEAKGILDAAAPSLRGLADDDTWGRANLGQCAAATTRDDCAGLSDYMTRFPDGKHVTEARTAYATADQKLTAKEKAEAQQANAQQAAAAAQQRKQACKNDCPNQCIAYTTDDARAKCVARCIQGCPQ